jgi:hypothetical protein
MNATLAAAIVAACLFGAVAPGTRLRGLIPAGVMVSSVLAVGGRRPDLANRVAAFDAGLRRKMAFIITHLILFILRAPQVDANVLCAGLSGYLLLGLLWVPAYIMVAQLNPRAFNFSSGVGAAATMNGFNAFYFSFITLCTVGYGDVTPVSKGAPMLALIEAIAGLFYVVVFISRLVAVYSATSTAGVISDSPAPSEQSKNDLHHPTETSNRD